ncbi:MAG: hypothetical protein EXS26_01970 [Opitutales bacterium]|nr:hypothetical protein [Opitutales bacterium]
MTPAQLKASAEAEAPPPHGLSRAAQSLWFIKRGDWEAAHDIAQDIETPTGAWLHALLHLIEGDLGNARYWFAEAGRPVKKLSQVDELWDEIAEVVLR